jgi:hypothetical protein
VQALTPAYLDWYDAPAAVADGDGDEVVVLNAVSSSAVQDTRRCAAGYIGDFCAACLSNYSSLDGVCNFCGQTAADAFYHRIVIIFAISLFVLLGFAVAFLSPGRLAFIVALFISVQQAVVVGVSATANLGDGWIKQLFSLLSILNFDIEMTKPGCALPVLTFVQLFWATVIVVVAGVVLVALCSYVRAALVRRAIARGAATLLTTKSGKVRAAAAASARRRQRRKVREHQVFTPSHQRVVAPLLPPSSSPKLASATKSAASSSEAPPASSLRHALSPVAPGAGSDSSDTTAALSPTATASISHWFEAIGDDDDDSGVGDGGSEATAAVTLANHLDYSQPPPPPPPPPLPPSSGSSKSSRRVASSQRAPSSRRTQGIMSEVSTQRKRRRPKVKDDKSKTSKSLGSKLRSGMPFGKSRAPADVDGGDDNDFDDEDDADDYLIVDSDDEIERLFDSDSEDDDARGSASMSVASRDFGGGADGRYIRLNRHLKGIAGGADVGGGGAAAVAGRRRRYGDESGATTSDDADYARVAAGGCCGVRCGNSGGCGKRLLGDPRSLAKIYFRFSQAELFHMRLGHSLLILAAITYLKLTTLALQAVYCVDVRDGDGVVRSRLQVELATVCFEGTHVYAGIFASVVIIPFALLFPVYLFFRLKRNFHSSKVVSRKSLFSRIERYGFMVRHLVVDYYWFQMFYFIVNFAFAVRQAFIETTDVSIFVAGILFLGKLFLVIWLRPYERLRKLAWESAIGFTSVTSTVVFLALYDQQVSDVTFFLALFSPLFSLSFTRSTYSTCSSKLLLRIFSCDLAANLTLHLCNLFIANRRIARRRVARLTRVNCLPRWRRSRRRPFFWRSDLTSLRTAAAAATSKPRTPPLWRRMAREVGNAHVHPCVAFTYICLVCRSSCFWDALLSLCVWFVGAPCVHTSQDVTFFFVTVGASIADAEVVGRAAVAVRRAIAATVAPSLLDVLHTDEGGTQDRRVRVRNDGDAVYTTQADSAATLAAAATNSATNSAMSSDSDADADASRSTAVTASPVMTKVSSSSSSSMSPPSLAAVPSVKSASSQKTLYPTHAAHETDPVIMRAMAELARLTKQKRRPYADGGDGFGKGVADDVAAGSRGYANGHSSSPSSPFAFLAMGPFSAAAASSDSSDTDDDDDDDDFERWAAEKLNDRGSSRDDVAENGSGSVSSFEFPSDLDTLSCTESSEFSFGSSSDADDVEDEDIAAAFALLGLNDDGVVVDGDGAHTAEALISGAHARSSSASTQRRPPTDQATKTSTRGKAKSSANATRRVSKSQSLRPLQRETTTSATPMSKRTRKAARSSSKSLSTSMTDRRASPSLSSADRLLNSPGLYAGAGASPPPSPSPSSLAGAAATAKLLSDLRRLTAEMPPRADVNPKTGVSNVGDRRVVDPSAFLHVREAPRTTSQTTAPDSDAGQTLDEMLRRVLSSTDTPAAASANAATFERRRSGTGNNGLVLSPELLRMHAQMSAPPSKSAVAHSAARR